MTQVLPLPIYPWPVPDWALAKIRAAKESLNLEVKVRPERAVAGSPAPILAVGKVPNFLNDFTYVGSVESKNLAACIESVITQKPVANVYTIGELLSKWFGQTVHEVQYWQIDEFNPESLDRNTEESEEYISLRKSIEKWGMIAPIRVSSKTYDVIDGRKRLHVAHQLGLEEVPVVIYND